MLIAKVRGELQENNTTVGQIADMVTEIVLPQVAPEIALVRDYVTEIAVERMPHGVTPLIVAHTPQIAHATWTITEVIEGAAYFEGEAVGAALPAWLP